MPYASNDDLLLRITAAELASLTCDTKPPVLDQTVVDSVIARASGIVEGYTRTRYVTPLQPSAEVAAIVTDIAVYLLYTRRPQSMKESVRQTYEDAIRLLKDVATGKASLDQPVGAPTPQSTTSGPVVPQRQDLRFNEKNLEGFC